MGFVEQGGGGHSGERKPFCAFSFKFSFQSFQVYKCGYKSCGKRASEENKFIGTLCFITWSTHQPQSRIVRLITYPLARFYFKRGSLH